MTERSPKRTLNTYVGDGRHIGYCTRCGADVFNGPLHRCPKKIDARVLAVVIAAKLYRDAERACRGSTDGSMTQRRNRKERDAAFDALASAIALLDEGTTEVLPKR